MSSTEEAVKPTTTRPEGWQPYIRKHPRSLVGWRKLLPTRPLFVRAFYWMLPWDIGGYPGKQRGAVELFGGRWSLRAIRSWRDGERSFPAEAALILADAIEARLLSGRALLVELRAYAAEKGPRKSGVGFRAIDPVTGQSGRPKVGRRKVKEL